MLRDVNKTAFFASLQIPLTRVHLLPTQIRCCGYTSFAAKSLYVDVEIICPRISFCVCSTKNYFA
jgi:hypothetical protein